MKALNCAQKENQVAPENAYVSFNDSEFTIVPETEGSELKVKEAYQMISEAVSSDKDEVDLTANPDAYVKADVTSDSADLQATVDAYNNFAKASITYTFGDETVTLDGSTIKNWLQFDEKGQLIRMMRRLNSILWIMLHSLQQAMILLELRGSSRQQAEEPYLYQVLHMAGRSIRMVRLHSLPRRSSPVPRQQESLYIPCEPMLTESMISVTLI
mgnify:CR=1 FL=1